MAESRGRRARVARTMGRPRRNGAQVLTVGELRAALPVRRRRRQRSQDSDSPTPERRVPRSGLPRPPRGLFPQRRGSTNVPTSGGGLRDLLESLSPRDGGSRRGRRTSRIGRGELEAIEAGKPRSEVSYRFAAKTPEERRRPRRERPQLTARQRRIRARRRRERAEAREARMARRSDRTERPERRDSRVGPLREAFAASETSRSRVPESLRRRPREEVVELAGMTITAPRPRVARRPMGGRRRRRG